MREISQDVDLQSVLDKLTELDRSTGRLTYVEKGALRELMARVKQREPQTLALLVADLDPERPARGDKDTISVSGLYAPEDRPMAAEQARRRTIPDSAPKHQFHVFRVVRDA